VNNLDIQLKLKIIRLLSFSLYYILVLNFRCLQIKQQSGRFIVVVDIVVVGGSGGGG
jgi:hypothetical protein